MLIGILVLPSLATASDVTFFSPTMLTTTVPIDPSGTTTVPAFVRIPSRTYPELFTAVVSFPADCTAMVDSIRFRVLNDRW